MSTVSFHDAPPPTHTGDLLPHGALSFGIMNIRPFNLEHGLIEKPSKSSDGAYLDCEITCMGGAFDKRKVFTRIGVAGSEKYINMGRTAIKAILEVGRQAGPNNMAAYGLPAYGTGVDWMQLDGLQVAFKIKVEKGQNGYNDKNDIAVWLSPIEPAVKKDWDRLVAGDQMPKASGGAPAAGNAKPAWATQAQQPAASNPPQQPAGSPVQQGGYAQPPQNRPPQAAPSGAPAWLRQ